MFQQGHILYSYPENETLLPLVGTCTSSGNAALHPCCRGTFRKIFSYRDGKLTSEYCVHLVNSDVIEQFTGSIISADKERSVFPKGKHQLLHESEVLRHIFHWLDAR